MTTSTHAGRHRGRRRSKAPAGEPLRWKSRPRYDELLTSKRTTYESVCGRYRVEMHRSKFSLPPRVLAIADGNIVSHRCRTVDGAKRRLQQLARRNAPQPATKP